MLGGTAVKQLWEFARAATLHPGDRADLGHLEKHGPEVPAHAGAAGDEAAAAPAIEARCVSGPRAPAPRRGHRELRGPAPRAARAGLSGRLLDSQGPCAPAAAAARGEGDDALRDEAGRDTPAGDVRRSLLVRITRATTVNDFAKLGTALGGRPTIVERLPRTDRERLDHIAIARCGLPRQR